MTVRFFNALDGGTAAREPKIAAKRVHHTLDKAVAHLNKTSHPPHYTSQPYWHILSTQTPIFKFSYSICPSRDKSFAAICYMYRRRPDTALHFLNM